ncbi:uncharacterized protein J4E79_005512 [Alternaria viburni]|uniref:uncharacterized protein n=1 Tax=Alternaria viburni TaxID=566460 RepID=UPI0020C4A749|nr:uncharacterized protein J4E79_005512 [Alternaria viburni]KAI4660944.1 hypothetical protein J4E79_005512 [Alternaria viburni]
MEGSRLVIGLDYGTTYTGVAFTEVSDANSSQQDIEVIHNWPSRHGKIGTREKVPSEVAYLEEGLRWGADIPPYEKRHMWTKLELDNRGDGEVAKILAELSSPPDATQKPAVEIIADFLTQVKAWLVTNLDDKYGKELWRTLPITLVVTYPAVWSDVAKHRTMQAVDKAGFNALQFPRLLLPIVVVSEPEAAAIHTIKSLRGTAQDTKLVTGDGFIVCDMGGGTVDLIAYRVSSVNPTAIEEATVGNGAQCGGSFVDRNFLHFLENRLGSGDFFKIAGCHSGDIPRTSLTRKAAKLLQDFTMEVKGGFSGTQINYILLPNPLSAIDDDESRGISDGELTITADDTMAMFDPSLRKTQELIQEQIQQARARKLKIKIKSFVDKDGIQAVRPSNAINSWSAVVRGATAKGLEGSDNNAVLKRKSRRYYGTPYSLPYSRRLHDKRDIYYDPFDGRKMAYNQMSWLVKKGQDLHASKAMHATVDLHPHYWVDEERITEFELVACNSNVAPSRYADDAVYRVATLRVDLSDIPEETLSLNISASGRKYYTVDCTVNISLQSSLEFFLTVGGKRYGSLTAKYD